MWKGVCYTFKSHHSSVCFHKVAAFFFVFLNSFYYYRYVHTDVREEKCPFPNCAAKTKFFKTKYEVKKHVRNYHSMDKLEEREEKTNAQYKKLQDQHNTFVKAHKETEEKNAALLAENKILRTALEMNGIAQFDDIAPGEAASMLTLVPSSNPKSKKRKRDPNAPKKPLPAYRRFFASRYKQIKQDSPGLSFPEYSKIISSEWKVLPEQAKDKFQKDYEAELPAFMQALAEYNVQAVKSATGICRQCGCDDIALKEGPMKIALKQKSQSRQFNIAQVKYSLLLYGYRLCRAQLS